MLRRPVIGWLTDAPGWAYENRACRLSACLPGYEHRVVCYPQHGFLPLLGADLVVCPDPRVLCFVPASKPVILNLNAVKLFVEQ